MSDEKRKEQPGEGNREADREYRERTRDFVESGKVDEAAERAREQDPQEGERAEEEGLERAKEVDPEVHREYDKPTRRED